MAGLYEHQTAAEAGQPSLFDELASGLYTHNGIAHSFGFLMQRRMTIVQLSGGRLLVHSPNSLEDGMREQLDRLGRVAFVVSPNKMHVQAIGEFASAYPEALFCAAPG